ncbi:la-related protein [Trichonephila clavipes]|nr:la-related protein [Trichonephila clavipes]
MRAKDKVERLAQEIKEKERQESMARQHRHQDTVAQSGPFRDFPRGGRVAESRPGAREWRERRKPSRAIPLPAAGQ